MSLSKHEASLDLWGVLDNGTVKFSREPDEPGDIPVTVHFPQHTWRDMGEPRRITVAIEPTDRLNEREYNGEMDAEFELWLGDAFQSWLPSTGRLIVIGPSGQDLYVNKGDVIRLLGNGKATIANSGL